MVDEKELLETTIQSLETWQDQRWISVPKCMRYVLDNALKLLKKQQWYGEHCGDCEES